MQALSVAAALPLDEKAQADDRGARAEQKELHDIELANICSKLAGAQPLLSPRLPIFTPASLSLTETFPERPLAYS